ncbi:type II toxin-antitoxin system ParD family antitoxin [Nostoc sp. FACHB-87]|uniref:Type II toxin-antitoxin system ParD family antitoxin n=1 Tax=Nostoc spongiaeforme FACHB-130 TaxID=1357510 RepID=A0ABR8FXK5_9NOSO|nr:MULTISPECIES: type II toxin-antitoxin system ParD family antitoxin [Nostocaceae]MBD2455552.1 type II toxin-antitoxin system ParD family antitoxin [Nostoc sp. FACHB-87]MBD2477408.1 type II toxin-antitoxin system ParD family antitoxin [Anabaena sp. FACHB-83]MBD2596123.1 type II toxin-antitoxin system ParD family antitoxin [Nostoc spongiaeforme FACHB-130]OCR00038.1 CopG family transcriptional regulator [Nostoc sp. MBR 210]
MNIQLKPEHEQFIQAQIASGRFTNADEVIDIAFQLLEKLNTDYISWIEETRYKVDVAIAEIERGEGLDGETVVMEILNRFQKAREGTE